MKRDWKKILSVVGIITALSAGVGAIYALYSFNIHRQKREIAQKLTEDIKEYLRQKNYIKKGEVIKIVETESQVSNYFMSHSLEELKNMKDLTTVQILNLKF